MKELTQAISRVAGKKAELCRDCGGSGEIKHRDDIGNLHAISTCPSCARLRELAEICHHEILATGRLLTGDYPSHLNPNCQGDWMLGDFYVCECGFIGFDATSRSVESEGVWKEHAGNPNPTYTIQTLKAILSDLGEWEQFKSNLFFKNTEATGFAWMRSADILTTDKLMAQAVESYLGTILAK